MVNFRLIFQSQISSFFLLHLLSVFRLQISRIFLLNGVKFAIDFSVAKFIICNRFVGRKFQVFIFPFATVILVANFKIFFVSNLRPIFWSQNSRFDTKFAIEIFLTRCLVDFYKSIANIQFTIDFATDIHFHYFFFPYSYKLQLIL